MNSGSFFIMLAFIVASSITSYICNGVALRCYRFNICRMIGVRTYRKSYLRKLSDTTQKLFLESYFDLSFCALMALNSFATYGLGYFFEAKDDIFCTVLSFVFSFLICAFPGFGFYKIRDFIVNQNKSKKQQVEVFLENCH